MLSYAISVRVYRCVYIEMYSCPKNVSVQMQLYQDVVPPCVHVPTVAHNARRHRYAIKFQRKDKPDLYSHPA